MSAPVIEGEDELMERRTLYEIKNRTGPGDLIMYYHSKGVSARRDNQRAGESRRRSRLKNRGSPGAHSCVSLKSHRVSGVLDISVVNP